MDRVKDLSHWMIFYRAATFDNSDDSLRMFDFTILQGLIDLMLLYSENMLLLSSVLLLIWRSLFFLSFMFV